MLMCAMEAGTAAVATVLHHLTCWLVKICAAMALRPVIKCSARIGLQWACAVDQVATQLRHWIVLVIIRRQNADSCLGSMSFQVLKWLHLRLLQLKCILLCGGQAAPRRLPAVVQALPMQAPIRARA